MGKRLNGDAILWASLVTMITGFGFPGFSLGQSAPSAQAVPEQVRKWIIDLADESFVRRETATRRLTDAGPQVIQAVSAAAISRDPEVAWRSRAVITRIARADDTSMESLLEVERAGPERISLIIRNILQIPEVQQQYKLFISKNKEHAETELGLARRDVMMGRSDSAWSRVRRIQVLDDKYDLFDHPNPILAVIACLEVESLGNDFRATDIPDHAEKIQALLRQARVDLTGGRVEDSRRFAVIANRLRKSEDPNSDPQLLLAEIDSITLLEAARKDLTSGRHDSVRKKMLQVEEVNQKYGLFARAIHPESRALLILIRENDLEGDIRMLNSKPQDLASALLQLARVDLDAHRFRAARDKASAAQSLGVDDRAKFFVKDIDDILNNSVERKVVAQSLLEISREFANEGDLSQAKNWLAHIIRVYPTTEASIEAAQMLKSLP